MAHVKLILLDDVENLGLAGDEVHVAPGYARQLPAAAQAGREGDSGYAAADRVAPRSRSPPAGRRELADAKALAEKLAGIELSIPMQATDDEQLFGSVTARMVADQLAVQGFSIDHNRVKMDRSRRSARSMWRSSSTRTWTPR